MVLDILDDDVRKEFSAAVDFTSKVSEFDQLSQYVVAGLCDSYFNTICRSSKKGELTTTRNNHHHDHQRQMNAWQRSCACAKGSRYKKSTINCELSVNYIRIPLKNQVMYQCTFLQLLSLIFYWAMARHLERHYQFYCCFYNISDGTTFWYTFFNYNRCHNDSKTSSTKKILEKHNILLFTNSWYIFIFIIIE